MALSDIPLYNFYRRYLWTAEDFEGWQTGMVDYARALFEGTFNGAVLSGGAISLNAMNITIADLIAVAPLGNPLVLNDSTVVAVAAPVSNSRRDLVVIRPKIVDAVLIPKPTDPSMSVYLQQLQEAEIVLIAGTPSATPAYPAKAANDTILFGVVTIAGQTSLLEVDIDLEVRDIPGRNSNFQQNQAKYDDRLRPFKFASNSLGIKPSQLGSPLPVSFSYVNRQTPSIFPKDVSGAYNAGDTYLNFTTGAITGADETSVDFTPSIPTALSAIVATVAISATDTIVVSYGTAGTRTQCLDGIRDQKSSGAGSVSIVANTKPIAFCIVYSADGSSITDFDFIDCRGAVGTGLPGLGVGAFGPVTPGAYPYSISADFTGAVILVDSSAARTLTLPAVASGLIFTIKDAGGLAHINNITIARTGAVNIEGAAASYPLKTGWGSWTFFCDNNNWFVI